MSTRNRALGGADQYRRATGWTKGTCTWCRTPIAGRAKWCGSPDCLLQYLSRNNPHDNVVKAHVFDRDRGRCRDCGRDLCDHVKAAGRPLTWRWRCVVEPWDLDHVLPVAEGGAALGLDNLQVLCKPCHKIKTAEQARRRAKPVIDEEARGEQVVLFGGAS